MGAVSFSIDIGLVERLKDVLPISVFVESGTFEGETIYRVLPFFEKIYTVELAEEYYIKAVKRFKKENNVKVVEGNSEQFLINLRSILRDKSTVYWLDAHWCIADDTAGYNSQCPLLQELDAIQALNAQSIILIDDARLFLCPPPRPHEISQWPNFDAVVKKLFSLSSIHEIMVVNDVIIYYPASISSALKTYARENSIDWLSVWDKYRDYDVILLELKEKETQIKMLAAAAKERETQIKTLAAVAEEKETQIKMLAAVAEEKETQIKMLAAVAEEKETQIKMLAATAEERLRLIEKLDEELRDIHR